MLLHFTLYPALAGFFVVVVWVNVMNTKIYKQVHELAGQLMDAANTENNTLFETLYLQLQEVCESHEGTHKDHPVQWETLADFTDDLDVAITIYQKALIKAEDINSKDFISSIAYSMANLQLELGFHEDALNSLEKAKLASNKIEDKELKSEIHDLLESIIAK